MPRERQGEQTKLVSITNTPDIQGSRSPCGSPWPPHTTVLPQHHYTSTHPLLFESCGFLWWMLVSLNGRLTNIHLQKPHCFHTPQFLSQPRRKRWDGENLFPPCFYGNVINDNKSHLLPKLTYYTVETVSCCHEKKMSEHDFLCSTFPQRSTCNSDRNNWSNSSPA